MTSEDTRYRVQTAQWVLERQLAWITAADIKIGVLVTIDTAMLAGLAAAYSSADVRTAWMILASVMTLVCSIFALIFCALSVAPHISGPQSSLLFFARVASMAEADYSEKFRTATETNLLDDWTRQIHRNAEVAMAKYRHVGRAIFWSFGAAASWIAAIALLVKT